MTNEVVTSSAEDSTQEDNSLDNMGTNILNEIAQAKPGENADAVLAVAQKGTETAATLTQAETKPEAEDVGTIKRLEQQKAESDNLLRLLNVDPDGVTAEQLRSGVITPQQHFSQQYTAPIKTETTSPPVPLDQRLTNFQSKVVSRQGDITAENYQQDTKELLGIVNDVVEANKSLNQRNEQSDLRNVQQQNIATVYDELGQTEVFKNLDPSVQETAKQMVLGAVDIGVSRLAIQPNVGNQAYTPAGYKHVANQFIPKFNELITKAFEAGKAANTKQIVDNSTKVVPITAGTGTRTVQPPQQRFKIEDMAANTAKYLQAEAAQV